MADYRAKHLPLAVKSSRYQGTSRLPSLRSYSFVHWVLSFVVQSRIHYSREKLSSPVKKEQRIFTCNFAFLDNGDIRDL